MVDVGKDLEAQENFAAHRVSIRSTESQEEMNIQQIFRVSTVIAVVIESCHETRVGAGATRIVYVVDHIERRRNRLDVRVQIRRRYLSSLHWT